MSKPLNMTFLYIGLTSGRQNGKLIIFFMYSYPFTVGEISFCFTEAVKQELAILESTAIKQMKGELRSLSKILIASNTDFT